MLSRLGGPELLNGSATIGLREGLCVLHTCMLDPIIIYSTLFLLYLIFYDCVAIVALELSYAVLHLLCCTIPDVS